MHFANPGFYLKIMPKWIPMHKEMVVISGFAEIAGGIGLLLPWTRRAAAWGIILLLIAVFPANIYMALQDVHMVEGLSTGIVRWIRLPIQFLAISWARSFTR
jgi:uncharacterized membrane protein